MSSFQSKHGRLRLYYHHPQLSDSVLSHIQQAVARRFDQADIREVGLMILQVEEQKFAFYQVAGFDTELRPGQAAVSLLPPALELERSDLPSFMGSLPLSTINESDEQMTLYPLPEIGLLYVVGQERHQSAQHERRELRNISGLAADIHGDLGPFVGALD